MAKENQKFTEAPEGKRFVLHDGRILKNLKELAEALEHMSEEVFRHHANPSKNDFSNWIAGVLHEKELAEELKSIDDRIHAQTAILKHIAKKAFQR